MYIFAMVKFLWGYIFRIFKKDAKDGRFKEKYCGYEFAPVPQGTIIVATYFSDLHSVLEKHGGKRL